MFTKGFGKVKTTGTAAITPKSLQNLTGAPAIKPFGNPVGKFGQRPRYGLMSITRLKDGLK